VCGGWLFAEEGDGVGDLGQDVHRIRLDCSLMSPCPAAAMHQAQAQEPSAVRAHKGFGVLMFSAEALRFRFSLSSPL